MNIPHQFASKNPTPCKRQNSVTKVYKELNQSYMYE